MPASPLNSRETNTMKIGNLCTKTVYLKSQKA